MLGELEVTCNPEGQGLIEALLDATREPDEDETTEDRKLRRKRQLDLMGKILNLPGRIDSVRKLSEILDRLVRIEREAYGIKVDEPPDPNGPERRFSDAEAASRASALIALAMQRRAAAQLAATLKP